MMSSLRFSPSALCRFSNLAAACGVCAVLDDSANALFVTEIVRGMAYTLKAYFDPKVTVSVHTHQTAEAAAHVVQQQALEVKSRSGCSCSTSSCWLAW
jgi:hypothetical protein